MSEYIDNHFIEEEEIKERLYNRKVARFLFKYIIRYKKYLFSSLFLVIVITLISLVIPYFSKIIIDRYIIKEGYLTDIKNFSINNEKDKYLLNKIKTGIKLDEEKYFLFDEKLKFFSKIELDGFIRDNIFSKEKMYLIEKPRNRNDLDKKIYDLMKYNSVIKFKNEKFVFQKTALNSFSFNETIDLRFNDLLYIFTASLFLILFLIFQFFSSYLQVIYLSKLSNNSMKDLRVDLLKKVASYEMSFFDRTPVGVLVNRITNDVEALKEMFSDVAVALLEDVILITGITIIIFRENLFLALIFSFSFPFIVIITLLFRMKSKESYQKVREKISQLNAFLNESIMGIKIIQIFASEKKTLKNFDEKNSGLFNAFMSQTFVYAVFRPLLGFIKWVVFGAIIYFGAKGILSYKISYGLLVLFLQYVETFFRPLDDLAEKFDIIISANSAGEKILNIFNEKVRTEKDKQADFKFIPEDYRLKGLIEFNDVSFFYKEDEWVIKDISFKINPGETIAIVGETGSGKTTIISLLSRFYDIQRGKILIDGHDIKTIPYEVLRKNIASVMQDVVLFSKNIKENIILNNEFNSEKFDIVTKEANIFEFINKFNEKENTPVMERGATFSSGERQLLSFARALYSEPSILILDEATSFIDSETEHRIQDAISKLIKGRTSIIIAHRLSTIKNADKILVIDQGKIVEQGTHQELIYKKGIYFNLYSLQFEEIEK